MMSISNAALPKIAALEADLAAITDRQVNRPAYLTDHAMACAEIGELAHLLARVVWCTSPEARRDPLGRLELSVIAAMAAQLPSVQCAAARITA